MTSTGFDSTDEGRPQISVGIVASDDTWARAHAAVLSGTDTALDVSVFSDPDAVTAALNDLDCVVVDRGRPPEPSEQLCRQILSAQPDVATIMAIGSTADRAGVLADVGPTDVYVRAASEPQPDAIATRVLTAVEARNRADARELGRDALRDLLAELTTPAAVTDESCHVEWTNPAYKAHFGLAERLPSALPAEPDGRVTVECETLGGPQTFSYARVQLPAARQCHVLAEPNRDGTPGRTDAAEPEAAAAETDVLADLTDRQREVLETAHDGGFFERPKTANSDELAGRLDITRSTFLQHLRTAQRKLLDAVLERAQ